MLSLISIAQAADKSLVTCGGLNCDVCGILKTISQVFNWLISISGGVAIAFLVIGGFMYLGAQGDRDKMARAKNFVVKALVGFGIILLAWLVVQSFLKVFGVKGDHWWSIQCEVPVTVSSFMPVERPAQLLKSVEKGGNLSAVLPVNTSETELLDMLKNLPEGATLTLKKDAGKTAETLIVFKKENGEIKILQAPKDTGSFAPPLINQAKADDVQDAVNNIYGNNYGFNTGTYSLVQYLIQLIQQNQQIIALLTTNANQAQSINQCIQSYGSWYRFNNACEFDKGKCSSTTGSCSLRTSAISVDGCKCPDSYCLNPNGQCASINDNGNTNTNANSNTNTNSNANTNNNTNANANTNANTNTNSDDHATCLNTGGTWIEGPGANCNWFHRFVNWFHHSYPDCVESQSGQRCACPDGSMAVPKSQGGDGACHAATSDQAVCENSGGQWTIVLDAKPYCKCPTDNPSQPTNFDQKVCPAVPSYNSKEEGCKKSGGTWIGGAQTNCGSFYGFVNLFYPVVSCTKPQIQEGHCACGVGKEFIPVERGGDNTCHSKSEIQNNCTVTGGQWVQRAIGIDSSGSIDSGVGSLSCQNWKRMTFHFPNCNFLNGESCDPPSTNYNCQCPSNKCVDASGRCLAINPPNTNPQACTSSGGSWVCGVAECTSNSTSCSGGGCACSCPSGTTLDSASGTCIPSNNGLQTACTNSGGTWEARTGTGCCFFNNERCSMVLCDCIANPNNITHVEYGCNCPNDSCLNDQGVCTPSNTPTVNDCGTDPNCFYNNIAQNKSTKLKVIEAHSFSGWMINETSEIRAIAKGSGNFEIVMTVLSLKKELIENRSLSAGAISGEPVEECPDLTNHFDQIEGKSASCTINSTEQARALINGGLTNSNINQFACYGNLISQMKSICGSSIDPFVVKKPAIYLYPEKTEEVKVKLSIKGKILKTEPSYPTTGWDVTADPSGLIDGKYGYLFYENTVNTLDLPKEGWVVARTDLEKWFDENLTRVGLNEKEAAEFKEYWLNKLSTANYYSIRLLSDEYLKDNMGLTIDPKPDTVIRRNFYFEPLDKKIELNEPTVVTPARKGFTVLEWGGILSGK